MLERLYHRQVHFFEKKENKPFKLLNIESPPIPSSFLVLRYGFLLHYSKKQLGPKLQFKRKLDFVISVSHFQIPQGSTQRHSLDVKIK